MNRQQTTTTQLHGSGPQADVSFVVPTLGSPHLHRLLQSVADQTVKPREVIIVDNAAPRPIVGVPIDREVPVRVVRMDHNTFFAAAANAGAAQATSSYLCVINDDTILDPTWTEHALATFSWEPTVGSVASRIRQARHPHLLDSAGDHIDVLGRAGKIGWGMPCASAHREPGHVLSASGTCTLFRRSAFEQVGGYDASFRAYLEDVDLGLRLQARGWSCLYNADATLAHVGERPSRRGARHCV